MRAIPSRLHGMRRYDATTARAIAVEHYKMVDDLTTSLLLSDYARLHDLRRMTSSHVYRGSTFTRNFMLQLILWITYLYRHTILYFRSEFGRFHVIRTGGMENRQ